MTEDSKQVVCVNHLKPGGILISRISDPRFGQRKESLRGIEEATGDAQIGGASRSQGISVSTSIVAPEDLAFFQILFPKAPIAAWSVSSFISILEALETTKTSLRSGRRNIGPASSALPAAWMIWTFEPSARWIWIDKGLEDVQWIHNILSVASCKHAPSKTAGKRNEIFVQTSRNLSFWPAAYSPNLWGNVTQSLKEKDYKRLYQLCFVMSLHERSRRRPKILAKYGRTISASCKRPESEAVVPPAASCRGGLIQSKSIWKHWLLDRTRSNPACAGGSTLWFDVIWCDLFMSSIICSLFHNHLSPCAKTNIMRCKLQARAIGQEDAGAEVLFITCSIGFFQFGDIKTLGQDGPFSMHSPDPSPPGIPLLQPPHCSRTWCQSKPPALWFNEPFRKKARHQRAKTTTWDSWLALDEGVKGIHFRISSIMRWILSATCSFSKRKHCRRGPATGTSVTRISC